MRFDVRELEFFWREAERPTPTMIVGAGRWGRVWASVLASARQGGGGITLVARSNHRETREWADTIAPRGIGVAASVAAALCNDPRPQIAIVASRPADHVRDGLEALSAGLDVLVEKPIASDPSDAARLQDAATRGGRLLGVGTEFALLPAFHQIASLTRTQDATHLSVSLDWTDPAREVRHGARKAVHDEVATLDDLLPHALSVFRILRPGARFTVASGRSAPAGRGGDFELRDQQGCSYRLACDAESHARTRLLRFEADGVRGTVDFAGDAAKIVVDGRTVELAPAAATLTSTLRLELGAFLAQAAGVIASSPLTSAIDEMIALHVALSTAVRRW